MGVFGLLLPVQSAMVLHGVAQTASNGSRIWLYRSHINWSVLAFYSLGAAISLLAFVSLALVTNRALLFILIGSFPFLAYLLPKNIRLNIEHKFTAVICGVVVTAIQMLAGASGPALDVFYLHSNMTRHQIMGTKAITQTLGHIIKLMYYAWLVASEVDLVWYVYVVIVAVAIFGNWLGKAILQHISDQQFRSVGKYVVMVISLFYLY